MFKIYLIGILLFGIMFINSCNSKKSTEPGTGKLNVTFELSTSSGKPGEIITLSSENDLKALGDIFLYFNDIQVPIFKKNDNIYNFMIPLIDPGEYKVFLKNISNDSQTETVHFIVTELPPSNQPPGKISTDLVQLASNTTIVLKTAIIPVLSKANILNQNDFNLAQEELNRLNDILGKLMNEINNMPEDQKKELDDLLNSAGIVGLIASQNNMLKKISTLQETQNVYYLHNLLASLDGFSAALTAITEVTGLVSFAAAIVTGGTSAAVSVPLMLILSSIDNLIDGCLPTDLSQISIKNSPLKIPYNGEKNLIYMGKFETQSDPIDATLNIILNAFLAKLPDNNLKTIVMDKILEVLGKIDINSTDKLLNFTDKWQKIDQINVEINPSYYDKGSSAFQALMEREFGINIPNSEPFNLIKLISGTKYSIEDNSIASLSPICDRIKGESIGTTKLIYGGYCFKKIEGNVFKDILSTLFGIETPQKLTSDQIEDAPITVESMTPNTIKIDSDPSGADIYLDGTNMNLTTPANIENVPAGEHHIRLYKQGYNEYKIDVIMAENGTIIINANLGQPLPPLPVFTIYQPTNNQHFTDNVISVSGMIHLEDAFGNISEFTGDEAILTLNGIDKSIVVTNGAFNDQISIGTGENTIQLRANSPNGDTGTSDVIKVYGDFTEPDIEITLTWNTPTSDLDLHVWNPRGEHSYYGNKAISDGYLDIDDVEGYGPETFTSQNAVNGTYSVWINCYSLDLDYYADATVQVKIKNQNILTFGPHHFTVSDGNGTDPDAWWDVYSFTISGNKIVKLNSIPETMLQKIKQDMHKLPVKHKNKD